MRESIRTRQLRHVESVERFCSTVCAQHTLQCLTEFMTLVARASREGLRVMVTTKNHEGREVTVPIRSRLATVAYFLKYVHGNPPEELMLIGCASEGEQRVFNMIHTLAPVAVWFTSDKTASYSPSERLRIRLREEASASPSFVDMPAPQPTAAIAN